MPRPFKRGLLGGTFDHFHKGHEKLLLSAAEKCQFLELWVTCNSMAFQKKGDVEEFEKRTSFLNSWIQQNGLDERITIHKLNDLVGPAEHRLDCDAIICTLETLAGCKKINETRIKSEIKPLEIIVIEHFTTIDGVVLSSSLIRNGEYSREGDKWINYSQLSKTLYMPKSIENTLKKPFGTLYEGPENDTSIAIKKMSEEIEIESYEGKIVAVGDVCVSALRNIGVIPDIAVVDGMTKRQILPDELKPDQEGYDERIFCDNPAGQITPDFSNCLISASKSEHKILIFVKGEEDLAPVILHLALPLDALLIYGQPNKGIVACYSNEEVKSRCNLRLKEFTSH